MNRQTAAAVGEDGLPASGEQKVCFSAGSHGVPWSSLKEPNIKPSAAHHLHMLVPQRHAGSIFVGEKKKKDSLWPVCLHCAELMLCWEQETSSPPDGCSLYCYTPPSGSPHRSPSASATGGERRRTASLPGRSPSTVSVPGRRPAPRGNLSLLSSAGPCCCSLLCCTQRRGSGWSPAAASPSKQDTKNIVFSSSPIYFCVENTLPDHYTYCEFESKQHPSLYKRNIGFNLTYCYNNVSLDQIIFSCGGEHACHLISCLCAGRSGWGGQLKHGKRVKNCMWTEKRGISDVKMSNSLPYISYKPTIHSQPRGVESVVWTKVYYSTAKYYYNYIMKCSNNHLQFFCSYFPWC